MAGYPRPRLSINPKLLRAIANSRLPVWKLCVAAGIQHQARYYELIAGGDVPDSSTNITRLERLAEAVGFPVVDVLVKDEDARG